MSQSNFHRALHKVLVHEGGKVHNKNDPGGRTNQGVTQRVYDAYRLSKKLPRRDVFLMEHHERDEIYRRQYWDVIKGDSLPPGVAYVVFDGAANSGPQQSVKWLQRALGSTYIGRVDGVVGIQTLQALRETQDHDALIQRIVDRRMSFLRALKTWQHFGRGWTRRVSDVLAVGQAWARGSVGPEVEWHEGGERKALVEDAKKAPARGGADAVTGGGIVIGGGAQAISEAKQALLPLAGNGGLVDNAIAVLTVAGVALTICGIGYRLWARRKASALNDALDLVPV